MLHVWALDGDTWRQSRSQRPRTSPCSALSQSCSKVRRKKRRRSRRRSGGGGGEEVEFEEQEKEEGCLWIYGCACLF